MHSITRRTAVAGILAGAVLADRAAATTRYRRLAQPDPALWHIDTPPTADGMAAGPNGSVYYRLYGKPGRIPVIVLHGGPAAGETYMRPYVGLAGDRQVVLYDQSGCGKSAAPMDLSRYSVDRYVTELDALRAHLGFERIVLVGHSWGGFLAPAYAAAHPERVAGLVLAGSAASVRDFADAAQRWLAEIGAQAVATAARAEAKPGTDDPAFAQLNALYYSRHLCRLDPWPAFFVAAGERIAGNPVYIYLNGPTEFQFTGAMASLDLTASLPKLRVPTLVTCGEYDEAPPWVGAKLAALIPGATLITFAGLSHMAHIEDPAEVVAATTRFLAKSV